MIQIAVLPPFIHSLFVLGFFLIALLLILVILVQKPQGGGLSGAFGAGASSGQTAFGAKTGDMLTWLTVTIFVLFILAAIGLNFTTRENPFAPPVPTPAALTGTGVDIPIDSEGTPGDETGGEGDGSSELIDNLANQPAVDPNADPAGDPGSDPTGDPAGDPASEGGTPEGGSGEEGNSEGGETTPPTTTPPPTGGGG